VVAVLPRRAHLPELLGERRLQRRVDVGALGEAVDAVGEHEAVGAADGVRAGEHDEVLLRQAALDEELRHPRDLVAGRRHVPRQVVHVGAQAVHPPRRHFVEGDPRGHGGVARREREDVRARHGARAHGLHGGLGHVQRPQPVEGEAVRRRFLLRDVAGRRLVEEDGRCYTVTKQSWKKMRMMPAAMVRSKPISEVTTSRTASSADGHVWL
ncbi:Os06g0472950, partial [Oryza sativa Japonica Group]